LAKPHWGPLYVEVGFTARLAGGVMILLLLIGIGVVLYLLIGLLLLSWIDYDYDLFHFIVEWPVPILELVLLFGWPVVLSVYCWRRPGVVR
jgi:hypothetical protein